MKSKKLKEEEALKREKRNELVKKILKVTFIIVLVFVLVCGAVAILLHSKALKSYKASLAVDRASYYTDKLDAVETPEEAAQAFEELREELFLDRIADMETKDQSDIYESLTNDSNEVLFVNEYTGYAVCINDYNLMEDADTIDFYVDSFLANLYKYSSSECKDITESHKLALTFKVDSTAGQGFEMYIDDRHVDNPNPEYNIIRVEVFNLPVETQDQIFERALATIEEKGYNLGIESMMTTDTVTSTVVDDIDLSKVDDKTSIYALAEDILKKVESDTYCEYSLRYVQGSEDSDESDRWCEFYLGPEEIRIIKSMQGRLDTPLKSYELVVWLLQRNVIGPYYQGDVITTFSALYG